MAAQNLINQFQANNNVVLETKRIKTALTGILTKTQSARVREAKIREYIKHEYSDISAMFEFNKARDTLMKAADASTTSSVEFFEGYLNIISEMVKETSDELAAQANENRAKAEQALAAAKKAHEEAQTKYQNTQAMDMNKELGREVDSEFVLAQYKANVDKAEISLKNAQNKLKDCPEFKPYSSTVDYFGISEADANSLLENQVNAAAYINVRRAQLEAVGVTSPVFMNDLRETFAKNPTYQKASAGDKKRIQQVYATNKLIKEELDSKKGFWGWVWKTFTHRAEAKAMRSYIKAADEALSAANFGEADIPEAETAMTKKGYLHNQYQRSGAKDYIKEKFAQNELKAAVIKEEKNKIAAISKLPLADRFFEIKFRPSTDPDKLKEEVHEFREVTKIVTAGDKLGVIPKDVVSVFKMTSKKISFIKDAAIKKPVANIAEVAGLICEDLEDELMEKGAHKNYQPMKYSAVQDLTKGKVSVNVDLDKDVNVPVSQPVEVNKTLQKDPRVKE